MMEEIYSNFSLKFCTLEEINGLPLPTIGELKAWWKKNKANLQDETLLDQRLYWVKPLDAFPIAMKLNEWHAAYYVRPNAICWLLVQKTS